MELWRKRLGDVTSSFERASQQSGQSLALRELVASTSGGDGNEHLQGMRKQVVAHASLECRRLCVSQPYLLSPSRLGAMRACCLAEKRSSAWL